MKLRIYGTKTFFHDRMTPFIWKVEISFFVKKCCLFLFNKDAGIWSLKIYHHCGRHVMPVIQVKYLACNQWSHELCQQAKLRVYKTKRSLMIMLLYLSFKTRNHHLIPKRFFNKERGVIWSNQIYHYRRVTKCVCRTAPLQYRRSSKKYFLLLRQISDIQRKKSFTIIWIYRFYKGIITEL